MTTLEFYQRHIGKKVRWIQPGANFGWQAEVIGYNASANTVLVRGYNCAWDAIYQDWLVHVEVLDDGPLPLPG